MATPDDQHGDRADQTPGRNSARHQPQMPWLPMPQAPANDNERQLAFVIRAFLSRHLNWLVPTLLLAGFSLALLILRS